MTIDHQSSSTTSLSRSKQPGSQASQPYSSQKDIGITSNSHSSRQNNSPNQSSWYSGANTPSPQSLSSHGAVKGQRSNGISPAAISSNGVHATVTSTPTGKSQSRINHNQPTVAQITAGIASAGTEISGLSNHKSDSNHGLQSHGPLKLHRENRNNVQHNGHEPTLRSNDGLGYLSTIDQEKFGNLRDSYRSGLTSSGYKSDTLSGHENVVAATQGQLLLKMLIPAYAAGSIIGKSGQTITHLQKQTGVSIKLSKAKDFYPGTTERIALIQGKHDGLERVMRFVIDKIYEFPIPKDMVLQNSERPKQVKLIVPNTTAGLIIGKKGVTVKQIMETSKAKVQMTQKPENPNMQQLLERVITICGERDTLHDAASMILNKIKDDPQSASCPNLSYQNVTGLVANANPVGSPYALVTDGQLAYAVTNAAAVAAAHQKLEYHQHHPHPSLAGVSLASTVATGPVNGSISFALPTNIQQAHHDSVTNSLSAATISSHAGHHGSPGNIQSLYHPISTIPIQTRSNNVSLGSHLSNSQHHHANPTIAAATMAVVAAHHHPQQNLLSGAAGNLQSAHAVNAAPQTYETVAYGQQQIPTSTNGFFQTYNLRH